MSTLLTPIEQVLVSPLFTTLVPQPQGLKHESFEQSLLLSHITSELSPSQKFSNKHLFPQDPLC